MGKKFDKIFETVISRGEAGGYLPGDCVKFRTGYKNTETYKHMPSTLKKEVDELATCGLNIKVVQVGDKQSGFSAGNQFKPAGCAVLTIAADHGGGRTYGRVTVTTDMVDESDGVLVPDKFKKKDIVIIKPMELKVDPNLITNVTDKGNGKNTPTNLKLAGESKSWDYTKELGMIYESLYTEGVDDAEKYRLINALRYAQKTGNASALKIATTNLQTWAKQTQGAYQDPEVLEFIEPQQGQAPVQGAAPAQAPAQTPQQAPAQAPTQPQGKQYPAYVRFKYNTNTIDRVFTQEELNKKIAAGNAKEDEYNPVNEKGEIMQDDGGVYDVLKFNFLNHDINLIKKLRGLNIPIKGDSYTQSQSQAQPQSQPAQAPPPTQPVVGESKSWESAKELGMLYESMMRGEDTIADRDRQDITQALTQSGFDGNGRFPTVGRAINKLTEVLDDLGYSLDQVYDERIAKAHYGTQENGGFKGQNLLSFRRKNESEDPFNEEPEIENSRISLNWENLGGTGEDATFEVVAYAS